MANILLCKTIYCTIIFVFRYMTILFYLNDVQEGGDTAFVVADNETISVEVCMLWNNLKLDIASTE